MGQAVKAENFAQFQTKSRLAQEHETTVNDCERRIAAPEKVIGDTRLLKKGKQFQK
jgi:hypothetical protein